MSDPNRPDVPHICGSNGFRDVEGATCPRCELDREARRRQQDAVDEERLSAVLSLTEGGTVTVEFSDRLELWHLASAVQMATRNPKWTGGTRDIAVLLARRIFDRLCDGAPPALRELADAGWDPARDVPFDRSGRPPGNGTAG